MRLDKPMRWLEALSDLEDGVTAPIFKAKEKKPAPPTQQSGDRAPPLPSPWII